MKKKYTFLAFVFHTVFSAALHANQFCAGFEAGYSTGYKQAPGSSMAPMCPMQPMKSMSDPQSDYEYRYTIGYRQGLAAGAR